MDFNGEPIGEFSRSRQFTRPSRNVLSLLTYRSYPSHAVHNTCQFGGRQVGGSQCTTARSTFPILDSLLQIQDAQVRIGLDFGVGEGQADPAALGVDFR